MDGIYRVKILAVRQDDAVYWLRYDISVGPCVGWATYMYQQTGKWPLIWRLDKHRGTTAIRYALDALNHSGHANIQSLEQAAGHHICLEIRRNGMKYIDVRRSLPASSYQITPNDIHIDTAGGWRKGDPNWRHALLLANLSGLSVLNADSREGKSPMVDWCAEHGIIILPQYLPAGDYTVANGNIIVDRKDNILELYKDFAVSKNRNSYENAALCAQVAGKQLVYVIGTDPRDHVEGISDLAQWQCTVKNQTFVGTYLHEQILRHQVMYPHISFTFVKREEVCQTIWDTLSV
ncbi:hypothetical protein [Pseudoflavonifractor phocaeensis]|uniref:hypothetical protein n=1 Tax=Pseudoflavonifractor phocaeensis TaxID=1870988 RepID=UPI0019573A4E|nr:hypothetical protein [Pseudoflavonifractor phocaeensis]MBM6724841.1 hypothetical protein [Pseudoflavonifractor phocaeensis]